MSEIGHHPEIAGRIYVLGVVNTRLHLEALVSRLTPKALLVDYQDAMRRRQQQLKERGFPPSWPWPRSRPQRDDPARKPRSTPHRGRRPMDRRRVSR